MDKVKLWLIPGIIVIIAIGGLIFLRGKTPEITPIVIEEEPEKPVKGFTQAPEPSPEEKIANDTTAMSNAILSGNIEDCEAITWDEKLKQQCLDNLLYANSLKSGDEEVCNQIANEIMRIQCLNEVYMNAALTQRDISLCELIPDLDTKQLCKDRVQVILAQDADSLDDCAVINSDSLRANCEDKFYINDSIANKDPSGCDNIQDAELKSQCTTTIENNITVIETTKTAIAAAKTPKTSLELLAVCDKLSGESASKCKDMIYPKLAIEEKDISYCNKISDSDTASQCLLEKGQSIDQYYLREAMTTGDLSLCDKIANQSIQTTCKSSI